MVAVAASGGATTTEYVPAGRLGRLSVMLDPVVWPLAIVEPAALPTPNHTFLFAGVVEIDEKVMVRDCAVACVKLRCPTWPGTLSARLYGVPAVSGSVTRCDAVSVYVPVAYPLGETMTSYVPLAGSAPKFEMLPGDALV